MICSPYHRRWLAGLAGPRTGLPPGSILRRLDGEAALRYGAAAVYDGRASVLGAAGRPDHDRIDILDQLLNHSQLEGAEPYPLGVTMWSQPWVPMWLEWEADVDASTTLEGWQLGAVELAPTGTSPPGGQATRHIGRTLLTVGAARTLSSAVSDFLAAEDALERATGGLGELDEDTERALAAIATATELLDLQTATLDGLRMAWLGVEATVDGVARQRSADGAPAPPTPTGPPRPLVSGTLTLRRLRLVDTFGRTLDLGPALPQAVVAVRNDVPDDPGTLALVPRLPRPARWMFRLVDAATVVGRPGDEALVDQVDPRRRSTRSPASSSPTTSTSRSSCSTPPANRSASCSTGRSVAGVWEIAPGRAGPPDSGPLFELPLAHEAVGRVRQRHRRRRRPGRALRRSRDRNRPVGRPPRDRHDAVDGRHVRRHGQRAHRRPCGPADRRRPGPAVARAGAGGRPRSERSGASGGAHRRRAGVGCRRLSRPPRRAHSLGRRPDRLLCRRRLRPVPRHRPHRRPAGQAGPVLPADARLRHPSSTRTSSPRTPSTSTTASDSR